MSLTARQKIIEKATQNNIPILGEFELTANCNFKCPFCYLDHEIFNPELSTSDWLSIFKQAIDNGLLFANLTGGEVFLRNDFNQLYEYLFDQGVKISIFTNGSILPDSTLKLLSVKKPTFVTITLYGHDSDSYAEMTKNPSSFDKVKENIRKLNEHGINTRLRTIPIKRIYDNIDEMIQFVKTLNQKLYYFSYVTKSNCHDIENQRLSPKELIDFENKIKSAFDYEEQPDKYEENYNSCIALRSSYFINHLGEMMPCPLAYKPKKSIIHNDFLSTFKELNKEFMHLESQNPCSGCELLNECNTCYARRLNEEGIKSCSKYLKDIASLRIRKYQIGNLTISLKVKYQDYFKDSLIKYETQNQKEAKHQIRTHFVDKIDLPEEEPDFKYNTRLLYSKEDKEYLYALNESGKVNEKFVRTKSYERNDIYFTGSDGASLAEKEYIFTGIVFMDIASYNGYVPIHGSAINHNNETIIFSAPSGVGKSTLARNWLSIDKESVIFNDDKPLIYQEEEKLMVCGSPWSGKDTINENMILPLKSVVFLKQSKTNKITEIKGKDKINYLFKNINRPRDEISWARMLDTIDKIVTSIPMYLAEITEDVSAAIMIKDTLYGGSRDES